MVKLSLGHDVQKWKGVKCNEQDLQRHVFAEEKGELIFFLPLLFFLTPFFSKGWIFSLSNLSFFPAVKCFGSDDILLGFRKLLRIN